MSQIRPGYFTFRCNICNATGTERLARFGREDPTCGVCQSSVRMRAIVHGISVALWGRPLAIADFPEARQIRGIGLSDWEPYADRLEAKLGYTNTYYHREPRLDITDIDPALENRFDFVVSTDVFEHVAPPVSRAFLNARRLLKDTGVMVFSVPFQPGAPTVEHFPHLHEYAIESEDGHRVLRNRRRDGELEEYRDLRFHGGLGNTLEMRVFGYEDLMAQLEQAGFRHLFPLNQPYFDFGIVHAARHSYPLLASPQPFRFSPADCFDWAVPGASPLAPDGAPGVRDWGPKSVVAGQDTVLWFTGRQLRAGELTVMLDGQPMADVVTSASEDTLTSAVPGQLTRAPGEHALEVRRLGARLLGSQFRVLPGN